MLPSYNRNCIAYISLNALSHNLDYYRKLNPKTKFFLALKANAYGHDLNLLLSAIQAYYISAGRDWLAGFFAATIDEALSIRKKDLNKHSVICLTPISETICEIALKHNIELCVYSIKSLNTMLSFLKTIKSKKKELFKVHLKLDTGMGRLGLLPEDLKTIFQTLEQENQIKLVGIATHFAMADAEEPLAKQASNQQIQKFTDALRPYFSYIRENKIDLHIANSMGLLRNLVEDPITKALKKENLPINCFARLGLGFLGYGEGPESKHLLPVMQFTCKVEQIKPIKKGESVSYGHTWQAPQNGYIAVLGCGYGDGYPFQLSNCGRVSINDQQYPVVGRVCMDQMLIFLDKNTKQVTEGSKVILWGKNQNQMQEIVEKTNLSPYVVLTGVNSRVPRWNHK